MLAHVGRHYPPPADTVGPQLNFLAVRAEWSSIPESNKDGLQMYSNMIINFNYTIISN